MTIFPEAHRVVLVVSGAGAVLHDLRQTLEPAGIEVRDAADDGDPDARPDVVVADFDSAASLPPGLGTVPLLVLVRRDEADDVAAAVGAGAHDVLPLPLVPAEVQARVAAAARLSAAEAALQARNAELSAWAHRAGHDLMTPLAVISGMAETLEAAWDRLPEADRARLLASIRNQASRATTMLDEAFALARSEPEAAAGEGSPTGA